MRGARKGAGLNTGATNRRAGVASQGSGERTGDRGARTSQGYTNERSARASVQAHAGQRTTGRRSRSEGRSE